MTDTSDKALRSSKDGALDPSLLMDNAACASQCKELLDDHPTRQAVLLNVYRPLWDEIVRLQRECARMQAFIDQAVMRQVIPPPHPETAEVLPKVWWVERLKQQEAITDKYAAALARAVELKGHHYQCSALRGMERDCHCGWLEIKELVKATPLKAADPYKATCEGGTGGQCTQPDCEKCWDDDGNAVNGSEQR